MKKLLLLSALLIFACSSDDNDLMGETFLERYDGVVWEINDPSVTPGLRMFNNEIQGWIEKNVNNANDEFCGQYIFGVQFEVTVEAANAFWVATLIENSENRLSYELTFVYLPAFLMIRYYRDLWEHYHIYSFHTVNFH